MFMMSSIEIQMEGEKDMVHEGKPPSDDWMGAPAALQVLEHFWTPICWTSSGDLQGPLRRLR